MKVLQINTVCGIRSTGRICTDIAEVLEKEGHKCKIAYGRETVPEKHQKYAVRIGSDLNVKIDGVKTRLLDNAGFNSKSATKKFLKWVKEYDPDIIHLHNLHGYYINIELLFKFLRDFGKPVVWTLHDCWAFTGHCSYFAAAGCYQWQTLCDKCHRKNVYPTSIFFNRAKRNFEKKRRLFCSIKNLTIVTPSEWLTGLVKQSFLSNFPVVTVNNRIDINVFKKTESDFREKHNLEDKKILLGVASAWGKMKGLNDFIKLSEKVDESYKIVLVGLKEEQLPSVPENILSITRTNNVKELAEIYTAADLFLNLTYQDTYPTVNLEAQACGTPVITYATGGSVESVPEENVVPCGNLEILCKKITEAEPYNKDIETLLKKAESFDKNVSFRKYLEIYKQNHV